MQEIETMSSRTGWALAAILAVVAILGPVVVVDMATAPRKAELEALVEAARAAGEPMTMAELVAWYAREPVTDNAADVYEEAATYHVWPDENVFEALTVSMWRKESRPRRDEPLPPDTLAAIERYVAANARYLELVYEAAAMPHCRFSFDLAEDYPFTAYHHRVIRPAHHCLSMQALLAAERHEPERAARAVAAQLAVAEAVRGEPTMWSENYRLRTHRQALGGLGLERVLSRTALAEDGLRQLAEILPKCEDLDAQATALIGQRCIELARHSDSDAWRDHPLDHRRVRKQLSNVFPLLGAPLAGLYNVSGLAQFAEAAAEMDRLTYFGMFTGCIDIGRLPPHERLVAAYRLSVHIEALPDARVVTKQLYHQLYHGYPYNVTRSFLNDLVMLRQAAVAVAAERYRLAHGKLPASLDDLVGPWLEAVPEDPFDGTPLRYVPLDTGYVVCQEQGYLVLAEMADQEVVDYLESPADSHRHQLGIAFYVAR